MTYQTKLKRYLIVNVKLFGSLLEPNHKTTLFLVKTLHTKWIVEQENGKYHLHQYYEKFIDCILKSEYSRGILSVSVWWSLCKMSLFCSETKKQFQHVHRRYSRY